MKDDGILVVENYSHKTGCDFKFYEAFKFKVHI